MPDQEPVLPASPVASTVASGVERPFYGQPFWWLFFALILCIVPLIGYMVRTGLPWDDIHPAINAILNGCGMVFMIVGYLAIRRGDVPLHKRCMGSAVISALVFLISYLIRFYISGSHKYPGDGWDRTVYLIILFSHMILAAFTLPMVLRVAYLGLRDRLDKHRRLARIALPLWLYVSVTGVIVYFMLYHVAEAMYGADAHLR